MILLHHLQQSRSFRILWAMEELNLDYSIQYYQRLPTMAAPPELKQIHPLGKAPVLQDGARIIAESAVILDYLQQQYDAQNQFKPTADEAFNQYNYWMHYSESSLMPLLVFQLVLNNVPQHVPFLLKTVARKICDGIKLSFIRPRLTDHVAFIEQHLSEHAFVAGDFSFADIQLCFALEALLSRHNSKYVHIQRYVQLLQQRPAYVRARAKSLAIDSNSLR